MVEVSVPDGQPDTGEDDQPADGDTDWFLLCSYE